MIIQPQPQKTTLKITFSIQFIIRKNVAVFRGGCQLSVSRLLSVFQADLRGPYRQQPVGVENVIFMSHVDVVQTDTQSNLKKPNKDKNRHKRK